MHEINQEKDMVERDNTGSTRIDTGAVTAPEQRSGSTSVPDTGASSPATAWRDRIRWGPVWAGALVVLPVFVVLQLLFFAVGWLDLGFEGGTSATVQSIVTGVLALIAFFVGGLLAGASTQWRGAEDGVLHGVLVWALSVVGILALAVIGGTSLLGPLADLAGQTAVRPQDVQIDPAQVMSTARDTAGWTALGLGLAAGAAALGGMAGSKIWPRRKDTAAAR
ncbi:hypothetical protein ACVGVM_09970 [Pseudonocardia bannensis]|uniref:Permease n=1 Tax=Pseudonocardia bannensis TaxID=630973 RepID=A0A848DRF8_9PSEU|nr:permease [Pseudonocardia bannensis]NMH95093.1 permease [Pseudonocardia bannensis]